MRRLDITRWLPAWNAGDDHARARLFTWAYPVARVIAAKRLLHGAHDIATTELAHEGLLRLLERPVPYAHRHHFLRVFAIAARQVWIDHVRAVRRDKRGGNAEYVTLRIAEQVAAEIPEDHDDLLSVLDELAQHDPRKRRVIDLFFFLGLERRDIARLLDVSVPTVDRDLAFSRAWLKSRLEDASP